MLEGSIGLLSLVYDLERRVKSLSSTHIKISLLLSLLQTFKDVLIDCGTEIKSEPSHSLSPQSKIADGGGLSLNEPQSNSLRRSKRKRNSADEVNLLSDDDSAPHSDRNEPSTTLASDPEGSDVKAGTPSVTDLACKLCDITTRLKPQLDSQELSRSYSDWSHLSDHIRDSHALAVPQLTAETKSSGKSRKTSQRNNSHLFCPICSWKRSTKVSYKDAYTKLCFHLYERHKEALPHYIKLFGCDVCSYKTPLPSLLASHMDYNHSEEKCSKSLRVACVVCGKSVLQRFMSRHMLVKHGTGAQDHHNQQPSCQSMADIKCADCGKVIRGRGNFEKHVMRIHQKVKDHLCHSCSRCFFDKKDLTNHMYHQHGINLDSKPVLNCTVEGCDYTSISKDMLTKHAMTRHTDRLYLCTTCGSGFKTIHNLKQHEMVKHPDPSAQIFNCPHCTFSSTVKQYVNRHMKLHTDVKRHRCDYPGCKYASHFSENVTKHKKVHTGDKSTSRAATRSRKRKPNLTAMPEHKITEPVYSGQISVNHVYNMGEGMSLNAVRTNPPSDLLQPGISATISTPGISNPIPHTDTCLLVQPCTYLNSSSSNMATETKSQEMLSANIQASSQCGHHPIDQHSGNLSHALLNLAPQEGPYPPAQQIQCDNTVRPQLYYTGTGDNSQIANMGDNSHIANMADNSHIANMADNSHIANMGDNAHMTNIADANNPTAEYLSL